MSKIGRRLLALVFSVIFMIIEALLEISIRLFAILSGAAHILIDVFGFATSPLAAKVPQSSATKYDTYGFVRAEVLVAFLSIFILWTITLGLLYEASSATFKFWIGTDVPINGRLMVIIACTSFSLVIFLSTIFEEHGGAFRDRLDYYHGHDNQIHDHDISTQNIEMGEYIFRKQRKRQQYIDSYRNWKYCPECFKVF